MGAALGFQKFSSAFYMLVRGGLGNAEMGGDIGLRATDRDESSEL
jgi:hypothetical protein